MQYERGRLAGYTMNRNESQVVDDYSFEYDANHNINKITSIAGVTEYDFDDLNQLQTKNPSGRNKLFLCV